MTEDEKRKRANDILSGCPPHTPLISDVLKHLPDKDRLEIPVSMRRPLTTKQRMFLYSIRRVK